MSRWHFGPNALMAYDSTGLPERTVIAAYLHPEARVANLIVSDADAHHIERYCPAHTALIEEVVAAARPLNEANIHGYGYDVTRLTAALAALDAYRDE